MIQPAVIDGRFLASPTATVCGLQYHLGGEQDTVELAELAAITADDHVLDVCCYLGGPAIQLAESLGCRVTGVDLFEKFIMAASRIAELAGLSDRVDFRVGNATNLPFEDRRFSVVWSQCALHHDEAWLKEFHRVLTQGGRLAITFDIRRQNPDRHSPRGGVCRILSLYYRDWGTRWTTPRTSPSEISSLDGRCWTVSYQKKRAILPPFSEKTGSDTRTGSLPAK